MKRQPVPWQVEVVPCPTCDGWRPLDKPHCDRCFEGQIAEAETVIRHILETAPWDSHEAHLQLCKEARAYFKKRRVSTLPSHQSNTPGE